MRLRIIGEVLKVIDLEIDSDSQSDYDNWRFRVELIADQKNHGRITARLWRKEFYRIQPTFPQDGDRPKPEPCDELVLVEETHILDLDSLVSTDLNVTQSLVMEQLSRRFNIK
jgi:hypothetical protein